MSILYITEADFLCDSTGIFTEKNNKTVDITPSFAAPKELTLTSSLLPSHLSGKCPVLFLLNDDQTDETGARFNGLFSKLYKEQYFIFHFQIGICKEKDSFIQLNSFIDSILQQYPCIDREQLCIGAFGRAVSHLLYITGHTNRFHSAFTMSAFVNSTTAYGNYENSHLDFEKSGEISFRQWLYKEAALCPLRHLDNNSTPYLIIHGHKDYICPEEQSEELFSAIKDRTPDVPCRLMIIPDENHELLKPGHDKFEETITTEIFLWLKQH